MDFKYADILQAMAERAKVSDTPWDIVEWAEKDTPDTWVQCYQFPGLYTDHIYRIKPRTIKIGNREVSEPVRFEDMKIGENYYYPHLSGKSIIPENSFDGSCFDELIFKNKLARRTKGGSVEPLF